MRRRASIGLVIILIAATIGIFAYVMANGSAPIGPPIPASNVFSKIITATIQQEVCPNNGSGGVPEPITIVPLTSYLQVQVSDPDGCTLTISHAAAAPGQMLMISNCCITNPLVIPEIANEQMTNGSSISVGRYDTAMFLYINAPTTTNRWVELSFSNN